ncbi:3,4-dihydroxyphenylacetaldehyde synthase [Pseudolycoriella hygida]|uniref:3,4-dihydroxyphenylacetaldehyde synthase n=1 Tax=Pseudolycoriella hygida TaxID=35572 RepID=A0A9Q0S7T4_9DIPT|nr:3,4-dihydroxyphenylacetaldehyde synthase [Pseudolycoriella hygida]
MESSQPEDEMKKIIEICLLSCNMNADEFRQFGHATIEFIAEYLENIRDR